MPIHQSIRPDTQHAQKKNAHTHAHTIPQSVCPSVYSSKHPHPSVRPSNPSSFLHNLLGLHTLLHLHIFFFTFFFFFFTSSSSPVLLRILLHLHIPLLRLHRPLLRLHIPLLHILFLHILPLLHSRLQIHHFDSTPREQSSALI